MNDKEHDWYRRAIIYQVDTPLFYDANGDGCGDIKGIGEKLRYIRRLGATTIWLTPFYLTPLADMGYDVADHLRPDPRFGSLEEIIDFIDQAQQLGLRVIIELIIQHTASAHPWFEQARRDKHSPYRDYYLWADEPVENDEAPMFPGVEKSVWSWDSEAGQYYRHMFYHHEPDLNLASPRVVKEIETIVLFWLKLGVSGFRLDAASHLTRQAGRGDEQKGYWILEHLNALVRKINPQAIILGEVDVAVEDYRHYFGDGNRLHLVLNFWLNKHFYVSLARRDARALASAIDKMIAPPARCGFANWLRNHDELDLEGLSPQQKADVLDAFAPDKNMYVYQRGIRRRLAPMLAGDNARLALAHAVLFALPGVPVLRYGDEIGMGDNLDLEERYAVRTPMQWSSASGAGFSRVAPEKFIAPPISTGPFRFTQINVQDALLQRHSLLQRVIDMANTRAELPEIATAPFRLLHVGTSAVLAIVYEGEHRDVLAFTNFSNRALTLSVSRVSKGHWQACLADKRYRDSLRPEKSAELELGSYGYRWFVKEK